MSRIRDTLLSHRFIRVLPPRMQVAVVVLAFVIPVYTLGTVPYFLGGGGMFLAIGWMIVVIIIAMIYLVYDMLGQIAREWRLDQTGGGQ